MLKTEDVKSLYTAGPIDGVTPKWATEWRRKVKDALPGWTILDPTDGKDLYQIGVNDSVYTPEYIVGTDLEMVKQAEIILLDWREIPWSEMTAIPVLRVGTSMEIREAYTLGKRIIAFGDLRLGYWIRFHATEFYDTLDEALEVLKCG